MEFSTPCRNKFRFEIRAAGGINLLDTPEREGSLHWKLQRTYLAIQGLYFNYFFNVYSFTKAVHPPQVAGGRQGQLLESGLNTPTATGISPCNFFNP